MTFMPTIIDPFWTLTKTLVFQYHVLFFILTQIPNTILDTNKIRSRL